MTAQLNLLLLAEESAGIELVRYLVNSTRHRLIVMSSPPKTSYVRSSVASVAEHLGVPCWPARDVKSRDFSNRVRQHAIDLLISVRSRYIVPQSVIEAPRIGSFNLHTGPLPRYAGINVINWAIYNGETHHAVTVHHLAEQVDGGAIAYRDEFPLDDSETAAQLTRKCFQRALPLLIKLIETASRDPHEIPAIAQDPNERHWYGPEVPNQGYIVWEEGAQRVLNFIRACNYFPLPSPWGQAKCRHRGRDIAILKAEPTTLSANRPPGYVEMLDNDAIMVSAGDNWVVIKELLIGDDRVDAIEWLAPGDWLLSAGQ